MGFWNDVGTFFGDMFTGGAVTANKNADKNFQLQQENLEYQKDLQKQIFQREDNAVQRRAADLEAAGLSKTLAAGSAANAGQAISTTAPQKSNVGYGDKVINTMGQLGNLVGSMASTAQTVAGAMTSLHDAGIIAGSDFSSKQFGNFFIDLIDGVKRGRITGDDISTLLDSLVGVFTGDSSGSSFGGGSSNTGSSSSVADSWNRLSDAEQSAILAEARRVGARTGTERARKTNSVLDLKRAPTRSEIGMYYPHYEPIGDDYVWFIPD